MTALECPPPRLRWPRVRPERARVIVVKPVTIADFKNDSKFDGYYVLGSGAAHGEASATCGGTVLKASAAVAFGAAIVDGHAGRLTSAGATAVGGALASCPSSRVRGGRWNCSRPGARGCTSVRVKALGGGRTGRGARFRRRTSHPHSPIVALSIALATGDINKLVFPRRRG